MVLTCFFDALDGLLEVAVRPSEGKHTAARPRRAAAELLVVKNASKACRALRPCLPGVADGDGDGCYGVDADGRGDGPFDAGTRAVPSSVHRIARVEDGVQQLLDRWFGSTMTSRLIVSACTSRVLG